ncbi:MAG: hypothetical protein ACFCVD_00905 [Nodosilinea sp.]
MTRSDFGFMAKVLLLSGAVGIVIKSAAPQLAIAPSLGVILIMLGAPSILMAGLLWLQPGPTSDPDDGSLQP